MAASDSQSRLNVLIVTQYFWPETFRINDLAVGLEERGHRVTVLTGMPSYPSREMFPGHGGWSPRRERFRGVEVVRVPHAGRGKGKAWQLTLNYLSFAVTASLLGPLLCRDPVDAVFVFEPSPVTVGLPGLVLKWLKSAPMLFWVQDLSPARFSAPSRCSGRWLRGG